MDKRKYPTVFNVLIIQYKMIIIGVGKLAPKNKKT
jgi:hypothetical protein